MTVPRNFRGCCVAPAGAAVVKAVSDKVSEITDSLKQIRRPSMYRALQPKEVALARRVFGRSLPYPDAIGIGDGLGVDGAPWTSAGPTSYQQMPQMNYQLNLGDVAFKDLTSTDLVGQLIPGIAGRICDLFIHELTHVWQYFRTHSRMRLWASSAVGSYKFKPGKAWEDYDVEQQASIVEMWHANGATKTDPLYPYVALVVRSGGLGDALKYARTLTLEELTRDLADMRRRGVD